MKSLFIISFFLCIATFCYAQDTYNAQGIAESYYNPAGNQSLSDFKDNLLLEAQTNALKNIFGTTIISSDMLNIEVTDKASSNNYSSHTIAGISGKWIKTVSVSFDSVPGRSGKQVFYTCHITGRVAEDPRNLWQDLSNNLKEKNRPCFDGDDFKTDINCYFTETTPDILNNIYYLNAYVYKELNKQWTYLGQMMIEPEGNKFNFYSAAALFGEGRYKIKLNPVFRYDSKNYHWYNNIQEFTISPKKKRTDKVVFYPSVERKLVFFNNIDFDKSVTWFSVGLTDWIKQEPGRMKLNYLDALNFEFGLFHSPVKLNIKSIEITNIPVTLTQVTGDNQFVRSLEYTTVSTILQIKMNIHLFRIPKAIEYKRFHPFKFTLSPYAGTALANVCLYSEAGSYENYFQQLRYDHMGVLGNYSCGIRISSSLLFIDAGYAWGTTTRLYSGYTYKYSYNYPYVAAGINLKLFGYAD